MLKIAVNGKSYNLPQTADDLTLRQYYLLREPRLDTLNQLGVILSSNKNEFSSTIHTKKAEREIANVLSLCANLNFSIEQFKNSDARIMIPKEVILDGIIIKVPDDVKVQPYGAKMHVRNYILEIDKDNSKADKYIADVIAHYLYCPFMKALTGEEGKYNEYRAAEFKEIVMNLPLSTAIQLSNFFLTRSQEFYKTRLSYWFTSLKLWNRRLVFRRSINTAR